MYPSIMTASGKYFDFTNPGASAIRIHDIAHALSNLCRFTGHCRDFYSVAQHSVLVSYIVPSEFALEGLLHDAAEAYVGDVASPLKQLFPEYKKLEQRVEHAIAQRFGLVHPMPACIKQADLVLLATEKRDLMPVQDRWALLEGIEPMVSAIHPMSPEYSLKAFMARFRELEPMRSK